MSNSFQPGPSPPAKGSGAVAPVFWLALVSALMVIMLVAVAAPRAFSDYAAGWVVTLGAGALTFAVILIAGFARRSAPKKKERF